MRVDVVIGDIVRADVDVIVNAANGTLLGGGGVDGAIHDAAGPGLLAECATLGGCPTGEVRVTKAHVLPFQAIIHAVGPIWQGGAKGEDDLLRSCYEHALQAAEELGAESIAFPAISTGAFAFPEKRAARIAAATCSRHQPVGLRRVVLLAFDHAAGQVLQDAVGAMR